MLTTVKITKGKALLHKTIKIADGTMSVKDYVAGALADYTDESLVAKKVKVGENFEEGGVIDIVRGVIQMELNFATDDDDDE